MKKKICALVSLVLTLALSMTVFTGCGEKKDGGTTNDTLTVAYSNFSNKFSPFFSESAYDQDVWAMTAISLLSADRGGAIIDDGINGTTVKYNGTDYTYYGLGKVVTTINNDGTVDYDITIRGGNNDTIYFSDGQPVTIDDVIFSMYAYSDTDYDGPTTFNTLPIEGLAEYRTGLSTAIYTKYSKLVEEMTDAYNGEAPEEPTYTGDQYTSFETAVNTQGWVELANDIISYCSANYAGYAGDVNNNSVALGMYCWGFGDFNEEGTKFVDSMGKEYTLDGTDVPVVADYVNCLKDSYPTLADAAGIEAANGDLDTYIAAVAETWMSENGAAEMAGQTINSISGITRTSDYSIRIHMTEFSAVSIYQLALTVSPLHYYGDKAQYNYEANQFGFPKGDLTLIRSKTTAPMGAGAYKFVSYKEGIVTFERNENYWEGCPKIKYIKFKEYNSDADKTPALINGDIDVATPSISNSVLNTIKDGNSNGELTGDKVTTDLVDYNGYGYIGICADVVYVGTKATKGSDASKNLRKGFATMFAVYRELAVNTYYGDRASVINYPISNCSWAAPQPNDAGYAVAYSKDVDGNAIYTADMTENQKYDAALQAAIGFFKAAGYTWDENTNKFTAAPEGASLSYEFQIPGDGNGDHPAFQVVQNAKAALETIGIEIVIKDLTNSSTLWDDLDAGVCAMWAAAWGGASDPDMYQVYHSSNATNSNHYRIADDLLDEYIIAARKSADTTYRKAQYKLALERVLDWGVEIPTYQRKDCAVYSTERIKMSTMTPDRTPYWTWMAEIATLELN